MVGIHIEQVVVGVNANQVQLLPCHGVVAVSNEDREIGNEDVLRVLDAAQVVSIAPEREFIDVVPRQFIVDGLDEINDTQDDRCKIRNGRYTYYRLENFTT